MIVSSICMQANLKLRRFEEIPSRVVFTYRRYVQTKTSTLPGYLQTRKSIKTAWANLKLDDSKKSHHVSRVLGTNKTSTRGEKTKIVPVSQQRGTIVLFLHPGMCIVALTSFSRGVLMQRTRPLLLPSNCSGGPCSTSAMELATSIKNAAGYSIRYVCGSNRNTPTKRFTKGVRVQNNKFETYQKELERQIPATAYCLIRLLDTPGTLDSTTKPQTPKGTTKIPNSRMEVHLPAQAQKQCTGDGRFPHAMIGHAALGMPTPKEKGGETFTSSMSCT